jgi:hypothetical protein
MMSSAHIASGKGQVWSDVSRQGDAASKAVVGPDLLIVALQNPQSPPYIGTAREGIHTLVIEPVVGTIDI